MSNDFENELDAIRVKLYEKNRGKSNITIAMETNQNGRRIAEKYGISVVESYANATVKSPDVGMAIIRNQD